MYALEEGEVHPLGFDRFVCFIATSNKSVVSGCLGLLPGLLAAPAEEENHSAGGGRKRSGDNIWGGVEGAVISYIFVRYSVGYTNVLVLFLIDRPPGTASPALACPGGCRCPSPQGGGRPLAGPACRTPDCSWGCTPEGTVQNSV